MSHRAKPPLWRSFLYAADGIVDTLETERNMKIHYTAACFVLLWNLCVRPPFSHVLCTLVACFSVLTAELLNTAIEHAVDLYAGGGYHPLAKRAKDAAAGAVLVTVIGAGSVGVYIGYSALPWRMALLTPLHWEGAVASGAGLCFLLLFRLYARFRHKLATEESIHSTNHASKRSR